MIMSINNKSAFIPNGNPVNLPLENSTKRKTRKPLKRNPTTQSESRCVIGFYIICGIILWMAFLLTNFLSETKRK